MRRLRLVRPCPEVPEGLEASLDRTGSGYCDRCGETVVDLTRPGAELPQHRTGRTCARVLVSAALVATAAGCGSSPLGAAPETQPPVVITTPPRPDAGPLDDRLDVLGEIEMDPAPAPHATPKR